MTYWDITSRCTFIPGLTSTSALHKIKRLYNHGSDHIVMIVTRKDGVWKCLVFCRNQILILGTL